MASSEIMIDQHIAELAKKGEVTRSGLMAIESVRHMTWAVVHVRLQEQVKSKKLIATKTGWRKA